MANESPETPNTTTATPGSSGKNKANVLALIVAAATLLAPFTMEKEGTKYHAYKDPVGIWTICNGTTKGVRQGMVATKAQCEEYYKRDMIQGMKEVVKYTPSIAYRQGPLQAAGDLVYNGGIRAYASSPSRRHFDKGEWEKGCDSFTGWYVYGTYSRPQKGMECIIKKDGNRWACKLPGLVSRRKAETKLCKGKIQPSFDLEG